MRRVLGSRIFDCQKNKFVVLVKVYNLWPIICINRYKSASGLITICKEAFYEINHFRSNAFSFIFRIYSKTAHFNSREIMVSFFIRDSFGEPLENILVAG